MRIHPAFAPVVLFLLAILGLSGAYFAIADWKSTVTIVKFLVVIFGGGWLLRGALNLMFPVSESYTGDQPLYSHDPWADVPDATVTPLQGGATRLEARGRAFIIARGRQSGKLAAREINPHTGEYISQPMFGSPRDLKGEDASLANLLKYKINEGR